MNDNSLVTVDDRVYVDPNVSLGETNAFIDNLRQIQSQNNQQISEQTHNLGSDLPLSMGGLDAGGGIWQSRYQTPQVDSAIASLRATTQAQALSQLLSNELAKKQQQYKNTYRAAYKKKEAEEKAREKAKKSIPAGGNVREEVPTGNSQTRIISIDINPDSNKEKEKTTTFYEEATGNYGSKSVGGTPSVESLKWRGF